MADPTDEIERIRALLAEAGRCGCDAPSAHGLRMAHIATLLDALDAKSAEVERLRRRIETMPPWPRDVEPLSDEQMRALKLRWSTGPERYQADADALIATVLHERAEVERLREKNRELNRRAQTAGSEAHKHFVREWLAGGDHSATVRVARVLGIDTSGKSFATLADETEAAMRERLGEVERLRHALQVAHDWMGRAPDSDCDEGGGWGRAHLRTAEETVLAALSRPDAP